MCDNVFLKVFMVFDIFSLCLGIVAFMDKKRYHEMTDQERGYFLDHMGVRSDYDQQKFGQIMRET